MRLLVIIFSKFNSATAIFVFPLDKLPKWIMGLMRCLTRWPFEHESAGFSMAYDHFEIDVYKNVQRQFLDRPPLLTPAFVHFLLAIVHAVDEQLANEKVLYYFYVNPSTNRGACE